MSAKCQLCALVNISSFRIEHPKSVAKCNWTCLCYSTGDDNTLYLSPRNQMSRLFVGWPVSFRPRPQASTIHLRSFKTEFSLASNVFYSHYGGEIKNSSISAHFGFVIEGNSVREITWLLGCRVQSVFSPQESEKLAFSNSCGLKSVFEKHHFRDGKCARKA